MSGMVPPHDLDMEAAVLSAIMLDGSALDVLEGTLRPGDFYSGSHQHIFAAALALSERSQPIDIVQIGTELKARGRIEQVGGMAYLMTLLNAAPAIANIGAYGRRVRELSQCRAVIVAAQKIAGEGYTSGSEDISAFIQRSEQSIYDVSRDMAKRNAPELALECVKRQVRTWHDRAKSGESMSGTRSGFDRLDRFTGGLHKDELTILAARPGVGKSSLAWNIAENVASDPKCGVIFFSLEMGSDHLATRALCAAAGIDLQRARVGAFTPMDWQRMTEACVSFERSKRILIDDTPGNTLPTMRSVIRSRGAEWAKVGIRIGLVVVDYLQLMQVENARSREEEVSKCSRGLLGIAKEMRVPLLALSQLNRKLEEGKKRKPMLSDLRESGAIEQDANNVWFVHRDDDKKDESELIIAKQRNGMTGTVQLGWDGAHTRFVNLPEDYRSTDAA